MKLSRRAFIAALFTASMPLHRAFAQAFPSRPITLVCPWPPGGGGDLQLRTLAKLAGAILGQNVLVENRPGATGTIGAGSIVRANPDGYTLAQSHNAVLRQPYVTPTSWDATRDFTYIIGVSDNPFGLVVKADSPWRTFQDLLDHARKDPGTVTIAVPGKGSPGHQMADQVAAVRGVQWTTVPYKGTAESLQALIGGHVTAAAESTGWVPYVDSGRARLLAVFLNRRMKRYPNVPTLKELGVNAADFSPWGIVGPAGMDAAVVRTLHDVFRKAMEEHEFTAVLAALAQEPVHMGSDEYRKYAIDAIPLQKALVEKYGLKQN